MTVMQIARMSQSVLMTVILFFIFVAPRPSLGVRCIEAFKPHGAELLSDTSVTFLPQLHESPLKRHVSMNLPPIADQITAESQFLIAQFILSRPKSVVFMEGLDFSLSGFKKADFVENDSWAARRIEETFPEGLPKKFENLTPKQQEVLATEGAPTVLLVLGKIDVVYGTNKLSEIDHMRILTQILKSARLQHKGEDTAKIDQWVNREMNWNREVGAIESIAEVLSKNFASIGPVEVLLVFGGGHNFARHFGPKSLFQQAEVGFSRFEKILDEITKALEAEFSNQQNQ